MAKQQLLVVEEDAKQLELLRASLEQEGFEVVAVSGSEPALSFLERGLPDLVVASTELSGVDGYGLVERMKKRDELTRVPVIFMASGGSLAEKIRGLELGVEDYLTKPVFVAELVGRVRLLLAKQARERLSATTDERVKGDLGDMAVIDLLESLHRAEHTGSVRLRPSDGAGREAIIYLRDGEIVDADLDPLRGEEVVFRVLGWTAGSFEVDPSSTAAEEIVEVPTRELLADGVRHAAECAKLLAELPALGTVLEIDQEELTVQAESLPEELEELLVLFDGRRSLEEVVDESPFDDLSTLSTVAQLLTASLLVEREPTSGLRHSHEPASSDEPVRSSTRAVPFDETSPSAVAEDGQEEDEASPSSERRRDVVDASSSSPPRASDEESEPPPSSGDRARDGDGAAASAAAAPSEAEADAGLDGAADVASEAEAKAGSDVEASSEGAPEAEAALEAEAEPPPAEATGKSTAPEAAPVQAASEPPRSKKSKRNKKKGKKRRGEASPSQASPSQASPSQASPSQGGAKPAPKAEARGASKGQPTAESEAPAVAGGESSDPEGEGEGEGLGYERELSESGVTEQFFASLPPEAIPVEETAPDDRQGVYLTEAQLTRRKKNVKVVAGVVAVLGAFFVFAIAKGMIASRGSETQPISAEPAASQATTAATTASSAPTTLAAAPPQPATAAASAAPEDAAPAASASASAEAGPDEEPPKVDGDIADIVAHEGPLPDEENPLRLAEAKNNAGLLRDAIPFAKAAIKSDPENADGYMALVWAYEGLGKIAEARAAKEACGRHATKGKYKGYCPKPRKK